MRQLLLSRAFKQFGQNVRAITFDFAVNTRAQITTLVALCLLPLSISTGVTVDVSRAAAAEEKLAIALEEASTLLAARTEISDANKAGFVKRFVEARFDRSEIGSLSGLSVTTKGAVTHIQAASMLDTRVLDVIGWDRFEVRAGSQFDLTSPENG